MNTYRKAVSGLVACAYLVVTLVVPANAAMIDTGTYLSAAERETRLAMIDSTLAREDVRAQLMAMGVNPEDARARAGALTDAELSQMAERMESLPAGGDVLGLIGAVFVVLLILELTGVIDIFKQT